MRDDDDDVTDLLSIARAAVKVEPLSLSTNLLVSGFAQASIIQLS